MTELLEQAMNEPGGDLVPVFLMRKASWWKRTNKEHRECVQLVATPNFEPLDGEPAVGYSITPVNSEAWPE